MHFCTKLFNPTSLFLSPSVLRIGWHLACLRLKAWRLGQAGSSSGTSSNGADRKVAAREPPEGKEKKEDKEKTEEKIKEGTQEIGKKKKRGKRGRRIKRKVEKKIDE